MIRRAIVTEIRALPDKEGQVEATILRYNVKDDYNTRFAPGVFDASMSQRMPRMLWGHNMLEPIGRWTDILHNDSQRLDLRGQLDLTTDRAVPRAHQAYAQMKSGTVDQFSVGFDPVQGGVRSVRDVPGMREFVRATLYEASPLIAGAVPGTQLLAVRSAVGNRVRVLSERAVQNVPVDDVLNLILRLASGDVTVAMALATLEEMALETEPPANDEGGDGDEPPAEEETPKDPPADPPPVEEVKPELTDDEVNALDTAIDDVLAMIG